jgi:hypothetical protein
MINDYVTTGIWFLRTHLGIDPFNYQTPILNAILNPEVKRASIRAATRSGKSFITAAVIIADCCLTSNTKVGIIAPSRDKTKIIMTYILELLSSSSLESMIDLDMMGLAKIERLKREVSKTRVTFKNGSSIEIKTADVKGKGFSLMGAGYDKIIIDESAELTSEVWSKIARMLLESPKSKVVELYNPWFLNHCFDHSQDPGWFAIKISYQDCIAEGRFTQEQIDMAIEEIKNPIDRRVLLEAEFPETSDNSLFSYEKILKAQREVHEPNSTPEKILGIDVARLGRDDTIVYLVYRYGGLFVVKKMWQLNKQRLTKSAGDIIDIMEKEEIDVVKIDSTGIGGGLEDNLKEYIDNSDLDIELVPIVFSEKADDVHNLNRKSDIFFNLASIFDKGGIVIPEDNTLTRQLRNMQYEIQSNGKKKIIDNQEKSPDRADALAIACYVTGSSSGMLIGDDFIC